MNQEKLTKAGFKVKNNSTELEIPKSLLNRYKNLPIEYLTFLKNFKQITNKKDTAWFNLIKEFNGNSENEFKWNEFELLSLEWSEDDTEELEAVAEFENVKKVCNNFDELIELLEKKELKNIV